MDASGAATGNRRGPRALRGRDSRQGRFRRPARPGAAAPPPLSQRMRIVVIGSGFGGLAAAVRLLVQGHQVTIVEQRDRPGGRAYVYEQDGFTFDGGPTIITAPSLITELFTLAGRRAEDYLTLVPISPYYNVRFGDG